MSDVKLGALCWNQYTDWPSLLEAGTAGGPSSAIDTLWTWDHLYPIVGRSNGPMFEGWLTLAAWAQATERIRIGLMVGANTFRNPAADRQDGDDARPHLGGRAILGIGAAWFEEEHAAFGLEFGSGFPERLRWLGEALPVIRGMLHGERPTAAGPHYAAKDVRNDPPPLQERLPLLVGGGGEQVTLKLVARYADANNVGGGVATVRRKEEILRRHCETVGRDQAEIERTTNIGTVIIRDARGRGRTRSMPRCSRATATPSAGRTSRSARPRTSPSGSRRSSSIGYRHLVAGFPSPYDEESMTRFATEVRPILERA